MKNIFYAILCSLFLLTACSKQAGIAEDTGDVNTSSGSPITPVKGLTYSQMNGTYILFDSIHFIGNPYIQFVHYDSMHPIHKPVTIDIQSENGKGMFVFEGYKYIETGSLTNEFQTYDKNFTWKKFIFSKDSVFINYYDDAYAENKTLNISFKGYKMK